MKLHIDSHSDIKAVGEIHESHLVIDGDRYEGAVLLTPENVRPWQYGALEELDPETLAENLDDATDILVVGTGSVQRFAPAKVMTVLSQRGVGTETMTTRAACRTYNILAADGRNVAALLFITI